jgi:hypothetical protein
MKHEEGTVEGIGFSRAWRFQSVDVGPSVVGSVFRPPGGRENWIAIVNDTSITKLLWAAGTSRPERRSGRHAFPSTNGRHLP